MPPLRAVSAATSAVRPPSLSPVDLKTARGLKASINELLKTVRMTQTPPALQPKYDGDKQVWRTSDGRALFPVTLQTPPRGSADMFTTSALVDPKTNQFFMLRTGGIAGIPFFNGPLALPKKSQFKHPPYSLSDLRALAAAANAKPAPQHLTPKVVSAHYSPGMGMRPPPGVYAGPSVNLELAFDRPGVELRAKAVIDEKKHTMTVTLDATADADSQKVKADAFSQDLRLHVPRPNDFNKNYKLIVKDTKGKVLATETFRNVLPM